MAPQADTILTPAACIDSAGIRAVAYDAGVFLSYQVAPWFVKAAVYPLERTRLLMQTRHTNRSVDGVPLRSVGETVRHMRREGRLFSAGWKGFTPTVVRWGPAQYGHLFLKDYLSGVAPQYSKQREYRRWFATKVATGAATGLLVAGCWAYPFDVLRQQLATKNSGTWRASVADIYGRFGISGFYRGFAMAAPGMAVFRGVQLGGWDVVKEAYPRAEWERKSFLNRAFHAQAISITGSFCAYPCDTIRRSLMACGSQTSYGDVIRTGIQGAGGVRRFFYAGFTARVLSSFVNGALLEGFDQWKVVREQARP